MIIGDFNFDITTMNIYSQEHLSYLLESGYCPEFTGITRSSANNVSRGSCIDNIFIKTNNIKTKTFKLTNSITDHYIIFISIGKVSYSTNNEQLPSMNPNKLKKKCTTN